MRKTEKDYELADLDDGTGVAGAGVGAGDENGRAFGTLGRAEE